MWSCRKDVLENLISDFLISLIFDICPRSLDHIDSLFRQILTLKTWIRVPVMLHMLKKTCTNNINGLSYLIGVTISQSSFQSKLHCLEHDRVIRHLNTFVLEILANVP